MSESKQSGRGSSGPHPSQNQGAGKGSSGPHPSHNHSTPGGAPSEPGRPHPWTDDAVDPDLEQNLGPELELRGDQLEAACEEARAEAAEWRDKALRAQAEFENARKRLESRHADEVRRAGERVIAELLPVMDDLERAADHVAEVAPDLAEGIVAVQRKLLGVMHKEGVSQIDPLGQPFDPALHQAVQTQEDADLPDHTVAAVYQKGYEQHGRCLRPAMVVVCTGGPAKE